MMRSRLGTQLAWAALAALLSACTPLSRVTLLPEADGRATAVQVVGAAGGTQLLDQPYAVAAVQRTGTVDRGQTTAEALQAQYGALLALPSPQVQRFVLQFEPGTATLTADSQAQLPGVLAQARALPGGELVVVGHTDRTGSPQANDVLSLQRAQAVREQYPQLLALQPPPAERFVLEFEPGTSQLTADSQARLDEIIARARARAGGEIVVTGHTDRQGSLEDNDRLARERAQAISTLLIERGFKAELIEAVGRGEREPLVPTDDEVAEPRNRRAELLVR